MTSPELEGNGLADRGQARSGGLCECCGRERGGNGHHRKLRQMGGSEPDERIENIVWVCGSGTTGCHGIIHHERGLAAAYGWTVAQHAEPSQVPVLHRGLWALLSPAGTVDHLGLRPDLPPPHRWMALVLGRPDPLRRL